MAWVRWSNYYCGEFSYYFQMTVFSLDFNAKLYSEVLSAELEGHENILNLMGINSGVDCTITQTDNGGGDQMRTAKSLLIVVRSVPTPWRRRKRLQLWCVHGGSAARPNPAKYGCLARTHTHTIHGTGVMQVRLCPFVRCHAPSQNSTWFGWDRPMVTEGLTTHLLLKFFLMPNLYVPVCIHTKYYKVFCSNLCSDNSLAVWILSLECKYF